MQQQRYNGTTTGSPLEESEFAQEFADTISDAERHLAGAVNIIIIVSSVTIAITDDVHW